MYMITSITDRRDKKPGSLVADPLNLNNALFTVDSNTLKKEYPRINSSSHSSKEITQKTKQTLKMKATGFPSCRHPEPVYMVTGLILAKDLALDVENESISFQIKCEKGAFFAYQLPKLETKGLKARRETFADPEAFSLPGDDGIHNNEKELTIQSTEVESADRWAREMEQIIQTL